MVGWIASVAECLSISDTFSASERAELDALTASLVRAEGGVHIAWTTACLCALGAMLLGAAVALFFQPPHALKDHKTTAAIQIQRTIRGWQQRQRYTALKTAKSAQRSALREHSAATIQHYVRRRNTMRGNMAITIQSFYRGCMVRSGVATRRSAVVCVQRAVRGWVKGRHTAAFIIQCAVRRGAARWRAMIREDAAIVIQRHFHYYQQVKAQRERSAYVIQCAVRRWQAQSRCCVRLNAVIIIQSHIRAFLYKQTLHEAATLIQRNVRSFAASRNLAATKAAVKTMQKAVRCYLNKRTVAALVLQHWIKRVDQKVRDTALLKSVQTIQRFVRKCQYRRCIVSVLHRTQEICRARREKIRLGRAAVVIQTFVREFLEERRITRVLLDATNWHASRKVTSEERTTRSAISLEEDDLRTMLAVTEASAVTTLIMNDQPASPRDTTGPTFAEVLSHGMGDPDSTINSDGSDPSEPPQSPESEPLSLSLSEPRSTSPPGGRVTVWSQGVDAMGIDDLVDRMDQSFQSPSPATTAGTIPQGVPPPMLGEDSASPTSSRGSGDTVSEKGVLEVDLNDTASEVSSRSECGGGSVIVESLADLKDVVPLDPLDDLANAMLSGRLSAVLSCLNAEETPRLSEQLSSQLYANQIPSSASPRSARKPPLSPRLF